MPWPNPRINTNLVGDYTSPLVNDYAWLQKGYTYGVNDAGPFQRFAREGLVAAVQNWAGILDNAGWTWTVTLLHTNTHGTNASPNVGNNPTGIARIEASAGWAYPMLYGTETPENIWELDPQDGQKDLLSADFSNMSYSSTLNLDTYISATMNSKKTRLALSVIGQDPNAQWATAAVTGTYGQVTMSTGLIYVFDNGAGGDDTDSYVGLPAADYATAYSLYLLIQAGVTEYPLEASVIRHSQVTSNLYAVQANYSNVGRIISSGSMTTIEGTPSNLLFAVPNTPTPQQFIEFQGDLQYGWRKVRPAVSRLSRMKWRFVQNYQFGLWPTQLYGTTV